MFRLVCIVLCVLVAACSQPVEVQPEKPDPIVQLANKVGESLYVTVSVNGTDPQRFSGINWSVKVSGIIRGAQNNIDIAWYEQFLDYDLLLARQQQTFFVEDGASQFTVTAPFSSEGGEFDCDSDGVSNLAERLASTDPCSGEFQYEPDMVALAAGCFDMGSPLTELEREADEGPQKNVCVEAFEISRFEATFREYDAFTTATSRTPANDYGWGRENQPVLASWLDATAYAAWLSEVTGKNYRLPTEAEWEYAARADTNTPFSTGERIEPDEANFDGRFTYNGSQFDLFPFLQPFTVGTFDPNPFGLFDMHGNVWEWTCSRYDTSYNGQEETCVQGTAGVRVARGGSWFNPPKFLRSANRSNDPPDFEGPASGFRVIRVLE
jgi:formylglycine-generating enzyme required for sulfatase activity